MNWDLFFNYGNSVLDEIAGEITQAIVQPNGTLYFDRSEGCGLVENMPDALALITDIRYRIVSWSSRYNDYVGNDPDRRIAMTQDKINFVMDEHGRRVLEVLYIPLITMQSQSIQRAI